MGLFSLTQELAIDLGTANTLIIYNGKVVVDEPSIVALDVHTGKVVAIGHQARQMHEKTNPNIKTIRPLKDGVIADFNATELMLRGMIKKVKTSGSLFAPSLRMVICIPSGSTNVEIRAVRDSAEHAGGREVYMIYEPMAAALGAGLDVEAPEGNMVIDIGGGTSEIACISLGGIVCSESINTAGDVFTNDIQSYVRQQHNIRIGERTAEAIKCSIGAAVSDLEEEPEDFVVTGPNMLTALPQTVSLSYSEIAYALEKSLTKIDAALYEELEDALLMADTGVQATQHLLDELKRRVKDTKATDPAMVKTLLIDVLTDLLRPLEKPLVNSQLISRTASVWRWAMRSSRWLR